MQAGIGVLLLSVLLLSACETGPNPVATPSPSPVAQPDGPGVLRWALGADPTSLDPARIVRDDDALLVDALFDSLTRLGPGLTPVPALATSWERNDDATSFTFTLDPGAIWHDGTPVTADDVVRGLERVADGEAVPPSLHASLLRDVVGFAAAQVGQPLRGVVAVDERTVRIDLSDPVPELPTVLAHPALAPVPGVATQDAAAFGEAPIGNGPFRLADDWAHNQFLRLVPSTTHPAPDNIAEVVFRIYAADDDRAIRLADLRAGQIQVSQLPSGRSEDVLAGEGELRLLDGLTDTASVLLLDTAQPPLDDVRFRRGLSLLLDREALAARTGGARTAARSLVPPSVPGAGGPVCAWCRHDPATAGVLIAQALEDREAGSTVPLIHLQTSEDTLHATMAAQLASSMRALGLEVRVRRAAPVDYLEVAADEQPSVIRLGWSGEEATLRPWTTQLFDAGRLGARLTSWQPSPLRDLLDRASASADADVRREAWQQVERLALDEAVVVPVLHYRDELVVTSAVSGLVRDPFGNVDLAAVSVGSR